MTWRRLAAATAAGLLGIHACRVYDEADTEPSDEPGAELTGGTKSGSSGGGAPHFPGARGGSGGAGTGASGGSGGGAPVLNGGRGGAAATSGGAAGKVGSHPGTDGGDPGAAPSDGGAPGDAGASNLGGAPDATGGAPVVGGGASGGSAPASGGAAGGSATGGSVLAPELIDDAEDADNRIKVNQGRNGYWSTFEVAAAAGCTLSPVSGAQPFMEEASSGTGTGNYALHFVSSGGAVDGCGVNLEFTSPVKLYDASDYIGISFGARSATAAKALLFKVVVAATDPRFEQCDPDAAADSMMQCYDHLQTTVQLTTAWQQIVVPFADLIQEGWGYPAGNFDATTLVAIQWVAKPGTADVWIDDVKFVSE